DEVLARVDELRSVIARRRAPLIIVTNEVGMSLVPETPLGRMFRDVAGIAHQRLARDADELLFAALGVVLRLRPGPVAIAEASP
ncbi:MAG TPA: bifunctional adenosylcobinamide kinase/adenosylcobinamide-phosphate guanylyltransferase, partial [Polyangia bacterium]|nr:bifunctional adenosylcobinamide kinase/adenosylcobinamide-phosphate guanylyltransferase [Polyangia bacterium]